MVTELLERRAYRKKLMTDHFVSFIGPDSSFSFHEATLLAAIRRLFFSLGAVNLSYLSATVRPSVE